MKPKSVYVKDLEISSNDLIEFSLELSTRGETFSFRDSAQIVAHNLNTGKTKKFDQANLNMFFATDKKVVDLKEYKVK